LRSSSRSLWKRDKLVNIRCNNDLTTFFNIFQHFFYKLQVTSYKLQVISYKLQVTSYKLQVTFLKSFQHFSTFFNIF
jgi:hypothetical protein